MLNKSIVNAWLILAITLAAFRAPAVHAEEWCDLVPGWQVTTHGGMTDNVYIRGRLQGGSGDIWIQIASATVGKTNVAAALAAQLAERNLSLYLDAAGATCANFGSWQPVTAIRHVRVL